MVRRLARGVRWGLTAILAVVAVALNLVVVFTGETDRGVYQLDVSVQSADGRPIKMVQCGAFSSNDLAEETADDPATPLAQRTIATVTDPFDGKPLAVNVPFVRHAYCLNLVRRDSHQRVLVVMVEYQDGKRVGQVVGIPRRSVTRTLVVAVP